MFETNLFAPVNILKAVLPGMRENVLIFLPNGRALLLEAGAYRAALAQGAKPKFPVAGA